MVTYFLGCTFADKLHISLRSLAVSWSTRPSLLGSNAATCRFHVSYARATDFHMWLSHIFSTLRGWSWRWSSGRVAVGVRWWW